VRAAAKVVLRPTLPFQKIQRKKSAQTRLRVRRETGGQRVDVLSAGFGAAILIVSERKNEFVSGGENATQESRHLVHDANAHLHNLPDCSDCNRG
jgi:hypothetical protein